MNNALLKKQVEFFFSEINNTTIVSKKIEYIILLAVLSFALLIRLIGINKGLPYLHHYDEPFVASRALLMLKESDFNPHWFQYPGLMIYLNIIVDVLHYLFLMGKDASFNGLKDLIVDNPTAVQKGGFIWTISHPSFFLWNRGVVALMATICIYFTYLIGKKYTDSFVYGLIAAALLAFSSTMVEHSRYITPNLSGALFVLGAIYYAIQYNADKKNHYLLLSLVFSGLAISTKYNFALCLIAPLLSYWMNSKNLKVDIISGSVVCVAIAVIVFFIVNPFTIIDLDQFLADMGKQVKHYKSGHGSHTIKPGFTHFKFQVKQFTSDFGIILMGLSAIGILLSLKKKSGWILLSFAAIYMLYMSRQKVDFHRNFLVIYPFITIWIAVAIQGIAHSIEAQSHKINSKYDNRFIKLFIKNLLTIVIVFVISFDALAELKKALKLSGHIETRTRSIDYINNYNGANLKVAFAKELRMHPQDLSRLNYSYSIIDHMDFKNRSSEFDLFVSGKFGSGNKNNENLRKKDSIYNAEYSNHTKIKIIKGRTINLKRFHGDPTIFIYEGAPLTPDMVSPKSFDGWYTSSINPENELNIGARGGRYKSRSILFEPGNYELIVTIRGNEIINETAKIELFLGSEMIDQIICDSVFKDFSIPLFVEKKMTNAITLNFVNDYFNSKSGEDRNFFVKDISIRFLN